NIQFAVDPETGAMVVIEMNPRVSRSSALASKATGFPIAKIAARLAVGYTLDEIPNDITRETPASFEPTIDYVVTKVPRWAFELEAALRRGIDLERLRRATRVDPWFLDQISLIVEGRQRLRQLGFGDMTRREWTRAKRLGFSDAQLSWLWGISEDEVRAARVA